MSFSYILEETILINTVRLFYLSFLSGEPQEIMTQILFVFPRPAEKLPGVNLPPSTSQPLLWWLNFTIIQIRLRERLGEKKKKKKKTLWQIQADTNTHKMNQKRKHCLILNFKQSRWKIKYNVLFSGWKKLKTITTSRKCAPHLWSCFPSLLACCENVTDCYCSLYLLLHNTALSLFLYSCYQFICPLSSIFLSFSTSWNLVVTR